MTPDDTHTKWLDTYTGLLVAELGARDCEIDAEVAREFIESTISMIATTTGTSERQARLSITETAVPAWATMLIEAHDEEDDLDFVAISGVLVAALETWAGAIVPLVEGLAEANVPDLPLDAAMTIGSVISLIEAGFLLDDDFESALEVVIPEDAAHQLVASLEEVTEWLINTDVAPILSEAGGEIDVPGVVAEAVDDEDAFGEIVLVFTALGAKIARAVDEYHRHLSDSLEPVLSYDDLETEPEEF